MRAINERPALCHLKAALAEIGIIGAEYVTTTLLMHRRYYAAVARSLAMPHADLASQ